MVYNQNPRAWCILDHVPGREAEGGGGAWGAGWVGFLDLWPTGRHAASTEEVMRGCMSMFAAHVFPVGHVGAGVLSCERRRV
jgi:hypothetical protein